MDETFTFEEYYFIIQALERCNQRMTPAGEEMRQEILAKLRSLVD